MLRMVRRQLKGRLLNSLNYIYSRPTWYMHFYTNHVASLRRWMLTCAVSGRYWTTRAYRWVRACRASGSLRYSTTTTTIWNSWTMAAKRGRSTVAPWRMTTTRQCRRPDWHWVGVSTTSCHAVITSSDVLRTRWPAVATSSISPCIRSSFNSLTVRK